MQIGLVLVALAFPLLELAVLIKVGQSIGFWSTVLLLAAMAVFGGFLVHRQGLAAAQRAMETVNRGEAPIGPAIDSFMIMLAGLLLLLPGLITDVFALALLIPPLRSAFAKWLIGRMIARGNVHVRTEEWRAEAQGGSKGGSNGGSQGGTQPPRPRRSRDDIVIDGEWQRVDEPEPGRKGISDGGPRDPTSRR